MKRKAQAASPLKPSDTANAQCKSPTEVLVLKFGGTSVGRAASLATLADTVFKLAQKHRLVLVLSAASPEKKTQGTTSLLLRAADEALNPESTAYEGLVSQVLETHRNLAEATITGPENAAVREQLLSDLEGECARLLAFLQATAVIEEISPRSRDLIVSVGEKLSCRLFTAILNTGSVQARYVNLEKIVARAFDPTNVTQAFYDHVADQIARLLKPILDAGAVPVVTGFFGPVPGSLLTTIGRGYTDLTAALAAAGLRAAELQIWKEVDGIFTADPRKVRGAQHLATISPEEAAELTYYGSEVIHPFTMEQVIRRQIPIRVRNSFNPQHPGTVICPAGHVPSTPTARLAASVTIKEPVVVLNLRSDRTTASHGFFKSVFAILDRHGIAVDLISTSQVHVSMAVSDHELEMTSPTADPPSVPFVATTPFGRCVAELGSLGVVTLKSDMAILSLVGRQMKCSIGIAQRMFSCLAGAGINIEMISQGASEINISCVIERSVANRALAAVHEQCVLRPVDSPTVFQ